MEIWQKSVFPKQYFQYDIKNEIPSEYFQKYSILVAYSAGEWIVLAYMTVKQMISDMKYDL